MTLILTICNPGIGAPRPLTIDRRDVAIGRAAGLDWTLPDPQVSSRHCEIGFRDGAYLLRDTSTNGTLINGTKLAGLHRLADRDVIGIGGLEILVGTGAAVPATPPAGMGLDGWQRAPAQPAGPPPTPLAAARTTTPSAGPVAGALEAPLAAALGRLLETRKRQLGELGTKLPDALARNPLAGGATALAALPTEVAVAAIDEAAAAIERHHAASLRAMQTALRTAIAELDPAAIADATGDAKTAAGDARDAALWRAYRSRFDGERLAGKGFVETFARAFREAYEKLA